MASPQHKSRKILTEMAESQIEFQSRLKRLNVAELALLALARLILKDSEGDGEAGALANELKKRALAYKQT